MLKNARFTDFTISELLKLNQQGGIHTHTHTHTHIHTHTQITDKIENLIEKICSYICKTEPVNKLTLYLIFRYNFIMVKLTFRVYFYKVRIEIR